MHNDFTEKFYGKNLTRVKHVSERSWHLRAFFLGMYVTIKIIPLNDVKACAAQRLRRAHALFQRCQGWGTHLFRNRGDFCANLLLWYVYLQDHAWDSLDNHEQAWCAMLLCLRTAGQLRILQLRENAALDISCARKLNTCPTISANPMSYTAVRACILEYLYIMFCVDCFQKKWERGMVLMNETQYLYKMYHKLWRNRHIETRMQSLHLLAIGMSLAFCILAQTICSQYTVADTLASILVHLKSSPVYCKPVT